MSISKVVGSYLSIAGAIAVQYLVPPLLEGAHHAVDAIPASGGTASLLTKLVLGSVLAGIGARILHKSPPPDVLVPTPVNANDGDGPAAGKASGEAGLAASKGPFKP